MIRMMMMGAIRKDMTVAQRLAVYQSWNDEEPLHSGQLWNTAYRLPAWCRENADSKDQAHRYEATTHGLGDYLNAAAIRELFRGEDLEPCPFGTPQCWHYPSGTSVADAEAMAADDAMFGPQEQEAVA